MENRNLTKEQKARCVDIWGCVPTDVDFVIDSKLFATGNDFATGIVTEDEKSRRTNIKNFLFQQGVIYS